MKKLVLIFLAWLVVILPLNANAIEINFPALSGQVVDEAGVLTTQEKTLLTQILASDESNQIAIAVVRDLQGLEGRDFGLELARHWQLGQKGKDNGVLILLATEDRYVGIEVGYGLEGILTDSLAGRIIREKMMPPLKDNLDYFQALMNGASAVVSVTTTGELIEEEISFEIFILGLISLTIFSLFISICVILFNNDLKNCRENPSKNSSGKSRSSFGGRGSISSSSSSSSSGGDSFSGGGGSFGGGGAGGHF